MATPAGFGALAITVRPPPVTAPANQWTWVPVAGAKCRNGSSTGFGVRIGLGQKIQPHLDIEIPGTHFIRELELVASAANVSPAAGYVVASTRALHRAGRNRAADTLQRKGRRQQVNERVRGDGVRVARHVLR